MNRKDLLKYLAGYILGGSFFLLLIPALIYSASYLSGLIFPCSIFNDDRIRTATALFLLLPGAVFMVWSNTSLFLTGKGGPTQGFGIEISPKTKVLVTKGPYRYTRNPMVFGAYSIYIALAFYLNSYTSLILVLLFLPVIVIYLKKSEEKRLLEDFSEAYLKYRDSVSLLIPFPPKK